MKFQSINDVLKEAKRLRLRLEPAFGPETSSDDSTTTPSSGHCAAVSAIVYAQYGGAFVSAKVHNHSHWFNRLRVGGQWIDVDITGDQFGRPSVQAGPQGSLYEGSRLRQPSELNDETRRRAATLAEKAGIRGIHSEQVCAG